MSIGMILITFGMYALDAEASNWGRRNRYLDDIVDTNSIGAMKHENIRCPFESFKTGWQEDESST